MLSSPTFRDRSGYAMACGTVRSLEKRLLDDDRLGELIEADDDGAIMGLLKRWAWIPRDFAAQDASLSAAVEASLLASDRQLASLGGDSPGTALLLMRFEMQNLAAAIKAANDDRALPALHPRGITDRRTLQSMAAAGSFEGYPEPLAARLDGNRAALGGSGPAVGKAVFSAWHGALLDAAKKEKSELLRDYLRHRTDLENIRDRARFLRHRRLWRDLELLPGGMIDRSAIAAVDSAAGLARLLERTVYGPLFFRSRDDDGQVRPRLFEREADDFLTAVMQPAKYVSLGPEALWGYYHGRQIDAVNIRAAAMEPDGDSPKARLRRPYV